MEAPPQRASVPAFEGSNFCKSKNKAGEIYRDEYFERKLN